LPHRHQFRLSGQKEVDVVGFAIRSFHIYTGEVLAPTEILQAIIVYFYQVEREILALVRGVKFPIRALFAFRVDICLDASGDISRADLFCLRTLFWVFPAFLWLLRRFLRMLRMLLGIECHCRGEEKRDCCCQDKS